MVNKRKRKNPFDAAKKCLEEEANQTDDSEDSKYAIVPQEILLHVFKFLTLSERCKVARYILILLPLSIQCQWSSFTKAK